jgi:hypothetical protein
LFFDVTNISHKTINGANNLPYDQGKKSKDGSINSRKYAKANSSQWFGFSIRLNKSKKDNVTNIP